MYGCIRVKDYKMYKVKNGVYGNDVETIATNEFYKCFSMFIL
jgi:hypothetical protein